MSEVKKRPSAVLEVGNRLSFVVTKVVPGEGVEVDFTFPSDLDRTVLLLRCMLDTFLSCSPSQAEAVYDMCLSVALGADVEDLL